MLTYNRVSDTRHVPQPFTSEWLIFYFATIVSSLSTTVAEEYLLPFFWLIYLKIRGRKTRTVVYPYISRNATILLLLITCFSYGFALPFLFVVTLNLLIVIYLLDRILIRYYYIVE